MDALYSVAMLIAAMAVLCALLEGLLPEGKLKKIVLFAIGLIFLIAVASSVIGILQNGSSPFQDVQLQGDTIDSQGIGTARSHEELLRGYYDDILLE